MNLGDHDDDDHYQQRDHDRVIRQELLTGSYGKFHIHAFILPGKTLPQAVEQGRCPCHYDIEAKIIEYAGIQKIVQDESQDHRCRANDYKCCAIFVTGNYFSFLLHICNTSLSSKSYCMNFVA